MSSGGSQEGYQLGAIRKKPGADTQISVLRDVTVDEFERINDAQAFLNHLTVVNPINEFRASAERILHVLDVAQNYSETDPYNPAQLASNFHSAVDSWLRDLRAFDDHTSHKLSHRFGNASPELEAFKNATREAYDGSFAYRFSYKLRNYNQHAGGGVQHFSIGKIEEPSGQVRNYVIASFDAPTLLSENDKWGTQVRWELENIGGKFDFRPILISTMVASDRVLNRMLVALETHIRAAVSVIRELAEEVEAHGDPFFTSVSSDWPGEGRTELPMTLIRPQICDLIVSALEQSHVALGNPPPGKRT
ncbi:hypothetical protein [Streptosporangium sp. NPDC004631]